MNIFEPHWAGTGKRPNDSRQVRRKLKPLSPILYAVTCSVAGLGIVQSLAFLFFNVRHRHVRMIKMSSPRINNLTLVGCMLFYSTVAMEDFNRTRLHALCHVRLFVLVLGFSLGYGALFAKTWRVYEIMTATNKLSKVSKDLHDKRLFVTVLMLVAVDMGVLVVWNFIDNFTMELKDIDETGEEVEDDVIEISQTLVCEAQHKVHFTITLLSLQGLLLLLGAFLAVQTRKVTIPELNDSRFIGLSIYNVVVLGTLGAILELGTQQPPQVAYLLESFIIIVGTTVTQCLIFLPKLHDYRKMKKGSSDDGGFMNLTIRTLSIDSNSKRSESSASVNTTTSFSSLEKY